MWLELRTAQPISCDATRQAPAIILRGARGEIPSTSEGSRHNSHIQPILLDRKIAVSPTIRIFFWRRAPTGESLRSKIARRVAGSTVICTSLGVGHTPLLQDDTAASSPGEVDTTQARSPQ
eukprot:CAMPEP_0115862880 /NCGR_PEP_ID=MMETSP0287-20121206/18407_1 /TAXON_ID=412157 /ORGANISM="Chrysochromulina rotalis, Strain UIO044" /LENGTH=120 /DNA_ID=CAMNT_0003317321 /DNA_START=297 /DNA_END=659 /DNA_ORIENTATION=+